MKKVFVVFVVFLLMLTICMPISAAEENVFNEGFENEGFEKVTVQEDGTLTPNGWSATGSWKGAVSLSTEQNHTEGGSYAAKIVSTSSSSAPSTSKKVYNIEPCATYRLSFWAYGEGITSERALRVKYEFYRIGESGKSEYIDENVLDFFDITDSVGKWVKYETDVVCLKEELYFVNIHLRLGDPGTVYFDDVSFKKIKDPFYFTLKSDSTFYYSDVEHGRASAVLNTYSYGDTLGDCTADFVLSDGETTVASAPNCSFTDGEAEFEYAMSPLEKKKQYTLTVTVKNAAGAVLQTESQSVYRYDRPKALNAQGEYMVDGKRFDPVYAYHVPVEQYKWCEEAGINVVQGSVKNLQAAKDAGLKLLVVLYTDMLPAAHDKNIEETKSIVKSIVEAEDQELASTVFAWAIMDEPYSQAKNPKEQLERAYKTIRDIDDTRPVYCVNPDERYFAECAGMVDILAIDPYPQGKFSPTTYVAEQTEKAKAAAAVCGRPVYVLLQAFPYGGYMPDSAALRNMWYQGVMGGAQGMGYYELWGNSIKLPENEDLWDGICDFATNELAASFDIAYREMEEYQDDNVWVQYQVQDQYVYAVIQSRSEEAQTVSVSIPGLHAGYVMEENLGDTPYTIQKNGLTLDMTGSGVAVCKLRQEEGLFFSRDDAGGLRVVCNSAEFEGATLYIAYYRGNVLKELQTQTITEPTAVDVDTAYDVKAFVFAPDTIEPLCGSISTIEGK